MLCLTLKHGEVVDIGELRIAVDIKGLNKVRLIMQVPPNLEITRVKVPQGKDRFKKEVACPSNQKPSSSKE